VFPAQLTHRGLVTALSSQLVLEGLSDVLHVDEAAVSLRFDAQVESAAYFCAVEFVRELDPPDAVSLRAPGGVLELVVSGRAGDTVETRTRHLADRVAPLGGTVRISVENSRATLQVRIPLGSDADLVPDLEQAVGIEG
jgi:hypothetical protein